MRKIRFAGDGCGVGVLVLQRRRGIARILGEKYRTQVSVRSALQKCCPEKPFVNVALRVLWAGLVVFRACAEKLWQRHTHKHTHTRRDMQLMKLRSEQQGFVAQFGKSALSICCMLLRNMLQHVCAHECKLCYVMLCMGVCNVCMCMYECNVM